MMVEQRIDIKFCVKIDISTTETFDLLKVVYGESALRRSAVFNSDRWSKKTRRQPLRTKTLLIAFFDVRGTMHKKFDP